MSSTSLDEMGKNLSEDLTSLKSWFDNNELIINLKKRKTESMIFWDIKRLNKLKSKVMAIVLNGGKTNRTTNYKYLEIHLDQSLIFEDHFRKTYKQAANRLSLPIKKNCLVDSSTAELTYRTMIVPNFGYCGLIFMGCSRSYKKRIEYIERKAKSVITLIYLYIFVVLYIPTIDSLIKKRACSLVFDS